MILFEEELKLSEQQIKLVKSGWGSKVIDDVKIKKIVYDSDGVKVNGFLAYPKKLNEKYPLVIWNRGGHAKGGKIDNFLATGIFGEIASWGYVVLASQYRDEDEYGGKEVNDILNLIPLAASIFFCDSNKIGMEGWSRGGMMSYQVLSKSNKIKCAIIISGLANLFRSETNRNSSWSQVYNKLFEVKDEKDYNKKKKERSAIYFANKIAKKTSILLIHGTADKTISYLDSIDMYEILKHNGVHCELKLIEGGDHYLRKHRKELSKIRCDWFNKFLKGKIFKNSS